MIIRSQDKRTIEKFERAGINSGCSTVYVNGLPFGKYSTEAKAIKVLDMICEAYSRMEDVKCGAVTAMKYDSFCFQLPQDSEVQNERIYRKADW